MIGLSSIWPKLGFLVVFSGFLLAFVLGWLQVARKKATVTAKLALGSLFFLLWGFLIIQLFAREMLFHRDLRHLRPDTIETIQVGIRTIGDPKSISEIVTSLNEAQWFASNHGGWATEVPLVLHFRSGKLRTYHVAFYLRQEGAVLISMSNFNYPGHGAGWSNGIAFCPELPRILAGIGAELPRENADQRRNQGAEPIRVANPWHLRLLPTAIFGLFTWGAFAIFYRLVRAETPRSNIQMHALPQINLLMTVAGVVLASMIGAGSALRVMYAVFDWPDPTNIATLIGVWLVFCATGIVLVLQRYRERSVIEHT